MTWLAALNYLVPLVVFAGSGLSSLTLVRKLKDPVQQKVLIGVALLLVLIGAIFMWPAFNAAAIGVFWFLFKVSAIIYLMIWFRGTFPRFRYEQLMNIGWKIMIPVGMAAIVINALLGMIPRA